MALEILCEDTLIALMLGGIVFLLFSYVWNRRPSGLPPFPVTPLPVIGNILSLKPDSRHLFAKWRKEFGDIFSLYIGRKLIVVVNGYENMKEALVKHGDVFNDTADLLILTDVFQNLGIISSSGTRWKSQRKFSLSVLRGFGFGKHSLEEKVLEEAANIVKYFASREGREDNFQHIYNLSTSNILCSVVFGRRYDYDDPVFTECCDSVNDLSKAFPDVDLVSSLPLLRYLPGDVTGFKKGRKCYDNVVEKLVTPEIQRHYKEYDGTVTSFISAYIKEIKKKQSAGEDTSEFEKNFSQTVLDLFLAGTETTATSLKWLILFFIHYPEVQERCFQEIRENVGVDRLPGLKDKTQLPYVEATLAETQRLGNIFPFISHGVAKSTSFHGFVIPKDASVMFNLDSVLMDPKLWPNPEQFRPERFLDKDGNFYKPAEFILFSVGRRSCLGEALAKMELFLFGSVLIQNFRFEQPEDELLPSLKPVIGIITVPVSYKVKAIPRK